MNVSHFVPNKNTSRSLLDRAGTSDLTTLPSRTLKVAPQKVEASGYEAMKNLLALASCYERLTRTFPSSTSLLGLRSVGRPGTMRKLPERAP